MSGGIRFFFNAGRDANQANGRLFRWPKCLASPSPGQMPGGGLRSGKRPLMDLGIGQHITTRTAARKGT
ncbi:unnamed protein product [Tuwongella immobilis]|uniref:Uncharacterized protein n=1 Tax=Tuwongella immobilis TaxID=692036 RepID=A0A6C2YHI7_9BACT|nr:unnamed protein product [Tuwongella immobilis]VTR96840.1 unnamed protein product [Tuwongella immobilis]